MEWNKIALGTIDLSSIWKYEKMCFISFYPVPLFYPPNLGIQDGWVQV